MELRERDKPEFNIFPTIFGDKLYIDYFCPDRERVKLELYDLRGRKLEQRDFDGAKGENSIVIDNLNSLPVGVVFYKVVIGDRIYSGKLIKSNKSSDTTHLK